MNDTARFRTRIVFAYRAEFLMVSLTLKSDAYLEASPEANWQRFGNYCMLVSKRHMTDKEEENIPGAPTPTPAAVRMQSTQSRCRGTAEKHSILTGYQGNRWQILIIYIKLFTGVYPKRKESERDRARVRCWSARQCAISLPLPRIQYFSDCRALSFSQNKYSTIPGVKSSTPS